MLQGQEMITIPKEDYDELMYQSTWLSALEAAGVDNWDGFEEAQRIATEWGLFDDEDKE